MATKKNLLNQKSGSDVGVSGKTTTAATTTPKTTTPTTTPITTPTNTTVPTTTPAASTPAASTPKPTTTAATTTPTTTTTVAKPTYTAQPFTYGDFTYDQQFQYDDFNYDKQFTYDDFSYDKQFEYGDFNYADFNYADYAESDAVRQANALLQQQMANKPGEYQSQWQGKINDYLNQIENRDPFSYDFNSDALYQQYKDNYIQQGQMAMMDTMGQAAAMTGGYGNSYAQSVGQQAYNQQLNQLNDVIPELYQMAYNRYQDEGQRLKDNYSMYMDQENMDYGKYQDTLSNWRSDLNYLTDRYDTERNFDYGQYQDNRNLAYDQYSTDKNLAYDQYQTDKGYAYDQYSTDKNLAYDQYSANKNLAYNEFTADRQMAYDQYNANRDLAYNEFTAGRDLAYDQYQSNKNIAYDQHTAEQDRAWEEYIRQQDNQQSAAELMANAGDFSRLAQLYGLSDAEVKAIKSATTSSSSSSTGSTGTKYKSLSHEDHSLMEKRIANTTNVDDLASLAKIYQSMGYDPAVITELTNKKRTELINSIKGGSNTGVLRVADPKQTLYYTSGIQYR